MMLTTVIGLLRSRFTNLRTILNAHSINTGLRLPLLMEMEDLVQDPRWTFSLSSWRKTSPSRADGISFEDELVGQSKGVQFITRMAASLQLPTATIFAASLFLHRFYTRNSLKRLHPYQTAAGSVFLACKTEESPRKSKDVAIVATKAALKLEKSMEEIEKQHAKDVEQWKRIIMQREDELLVCLKFDFANSTPYLFLNDLVRNLVPSEKQEAVGKKATLFVNDSCRTLLAIELKMQDLAVVALYWACKNLNVTITGAVDGGKWYTEYLSRNEIVRYINDMAHMMTIVRAGVLDGQSYEKIESSQRDET